MFFNNSEYYEYDAYGNCHVLDTDFSADADGISDYGNVYTFQGKTLDILDSGNLRVMAWPYRNYLPGMGRWLQYDKLGMIPNDDSSVNPFDIHKQFNDGTNLYLAMTGNPIVVSDPYGLTACCKINRTTYEPYVGSYYGGAVKVTKCTQETIAGYEDCDAKAACCAAYKDDKNVSVYEAEEGDCCWCRIYLKRSTVPIWGFLKVDAHRTINVECDENRDDWGADVGIGVRQDHETEWLNGVWVDVAVYTNSDGGEYLGSISCDAADKWKSKFASMKWWYSFPTHDCRVFATEYSSKMLKSCP